MWGKMCWRRSLPSARLGFENEVRVVTTGGLKGNLSFSRISKLNFYTCSFTCFVTALFAASDMADLSISNC